MAGQEGRGSSGDLSRSLVQGSDVLPDVCCDVCSEDGRQLEAEGFCVDCSDYLCRDCFRGHRRNRLSRHHQLQDKASMPRTRPAGGVTSQPSQDACTEACERHPDRIAEYFCQNHEQLGCGVCMTVKHRTCEDVDHIPDLAQGLLNSEEYKQFERNIESLKAKSVQVLDKSNENIADDEKCSSSAIQKVLCLKADVVSLFDLLLKNVKEETESFKNDNLQNMKAVSKTGSKVLNDAKKIDSAMGALKDSNQLCKLFIHMKKTQDELKSLDRTLDEAELMNTISSYFFQSSPEIEGIVDRSVALGQLCLRSQAMTLPQDPSKTTASLIKDINVKTKGDRKKCFISGIGTLSDNKLILADTDNCSIKLIDVGVSDIVAEMKMDCGPWDIAVISSTRAVATLPLGNQIVFIKISAELQTDGTVQMEGGCRGIAHCNGKLFVTLVTQRPNAVVVMDYHGNVERRIAVNDVRWLSHVAVDPRSQTIYVSDHAGGNMGRVTCITSGGTQKTICDEQDWKGLRGIAVDQLGRVLISGRVKGKIILLNSELQTVKCLIDSLCQPAGMCYCCQTNKLYIGFNNTDNLIKVFQLS